MFHMSFHFPLGCNPGTLVGCKQTSSCFAYHTLPCVLDLINQSFTSLYCFYFFNPDNSNINASDTFENHIKTELEAGIAAYTAGLIRYRRPV